MLAWLGRQGQPGNTFSSRSTAAPEVRQSGRRQGLRAWTPCTHWAQISGPDSKKVKGISMLLFKRLRHEEKHVDTAWRRRGRCFRRWRAVIMSHIWVISDT